MSATETAVYEKLRLLRVNGADFSGAMSWQDALGLMSSIDKALPDLLVGGTTGKFKILLKLIEMLQMSLRTGGVRVLSRPEHRARLLSQALGFQPARVR